MSQPTTRNHWIWISFASIALLTLAVYIWTSLNAGQGNLLMPLDDVYIHFQYAKQMALGHPYQYNLIDPPTSGATSLIYPYLLTIGYWLGFQGLWLGLWTMLLGTISLTIAQWAVYRLCRVMQVPPRLSLLTALTFGLSGSIGWHFMSGMETGLTITLTLLTLLFVIEKRLTPFLLVSTLLTITRPEGGLVAAIAAGTMFLRLWQDYSPSEKSAPRRVYLLLLALPILAFGLQPLVNLLMTGTTVATGAQAKSILSTVPQDMTLIISRIWDNFSRMWLEFITGYDAREGRWWYLPLGIGVLGLLSVPMLLTKKNVRLIGLMLLGWLLISTAAVSTLDNAFWHFKRYQMPMLALFFPLTAWLLSEILRRIEKTKIPVYLYSGIVLPIFAVLLFAQFQNYHAKNVSYVYQQPFQMANWLRENTPQDAIVAVHDVGLMRYHGERSTLDMVGLTTPNAAAYWRNGPGSVAEFLINQQPDYIASYGRGHGYGLAFLADTALYENQLADFTVTDWQPHLNVALAADSQGIYQPDWSIISLDTDFGSLCATSIYSPVYMPPRNLDLLDVSDIESETSHKYQWHTSNLEGFATQVRGFGASIEGYRLINDSESFSFDFSDAAFEHQVLVTSVHSNSAGTIDIYINDSLVDTQWIPANPGNQINISTIIEPEFMTEVQNFNIEIIPNIPNGYYMPMCHALRRGFEPIEAYQEPEVTYQEGAVSLLETGLRYLSEAPNLLVVDLIWYVADINPEGDYRLFVHFYDDRNQPPVAQWDGYFANMPLGNWQSGLLVSLPFQEVTFNTDEIPAGTYQLAIGFYNPNDPTDRLIPESDVYEVTEDGRLWLGEVEID